MKIWIWCILFCSCLLLCNCSLIPSAKGFLPLGKLGASTYVHHYHITQCGGSTLRKVLSGVLGLSKCILPSVPRSEEAYDEFFARLKQLRGNETGATKPCRFLSYEGRFYKVHHRLPDHHGVIMFRRPANWLFSNYIHLMSKGRAPYVKYNGVFRPSVNITTILSLPRVIENIVKKERGVAYENFQFKWLVGHDQTKWANLPQAFSIIDKMAVVGIVEFYGVSICLAAHRFNNKAYFDKHCECDSSVKTSFTKREGSQYHIFGSYEDLVGLLYTGKLDQAIYSYALRRFLSDVQSVEKQTGKRLIC